MRQLRRLRRLTGMLCLVLSLLGLGGYVARDILRAQLARLASSWLSRSMQGTAEIGALHGSLFSTLILQDVVLRDPSGTEVVRLDEVQLAYELTALLSKRLVIRHVRLLRPQLTLIQAPSGEWNLTRLFAASAPTPAAGEALPLTIVLQHGEIRDGHLALTLPSFPGVQSLDGVQARLQGAISAQGLRLAVQHLSGHATPADITLQAVTGLIETEGEALRLTDVALHTAHTHVLATGLLPGGPHPASLVLHLQPLDVTELGRLWQRPDVAGALHLALRAEGPPEALDVHAQLSTAGGQLDWQAQLNTSTPFWRYESDLTFTHVNLATLLHREPLQSDVNLRLHLEGSGTTLETLRGVLRLDLQASQLGDITLHPSRLYAAVDAGRLEVQECDVHTSVARLSARGLLDLAGSALLHYDLTADLAGVRALLNADTLQGRLRLQGQASGTLLAPSTHGTLTVQQGQYATSRVESLRMQYQGNPLGPEAHMTASLALQHAVVAEHPVESLTLAGTYSGAARQVQISAEVAHAGKSRGQARGLLQWTESAQQLTLEELVVQAADHPWRLTAPVTATREAAVWRLTPFQLAHREERITLTGAFDGTHFRDVGLQLTQVDVTFLQRWLALPEIVPGLASGQAHLAGTLAAPVFDLTMQLQTPAQAHLPVMQLQATLTYAQQRLQSEVRVRQGPREVVAIEAQLPLNLALTPLTLLQRVRTEPVTLRLRLQQPDLTALARWQPSWPHFTGTLQGDLKVQGPYTALALDADIRFQQWGLVGRVADVQGPLRLQATVGLLTADASQLDLRLHHATLRVPTLRGQLPGTAPPQQQMVQVQDLLVQAVGQWEAAGFTGAIERAQAQVRLPGWPHAEVYLAGRVTPQRLDLTQMQVRLPQSEVRGSGMLTFPQHGLQLTLEVPRLRLNEVGVALPAAWPPVVQGTVDVRGTLSAPQVDTRWRYAGGQLRTALTIALQEPVPRYQLTLHLDDLQLAQLLPEERGVLQARVQVQGSGLQAPQRRADVDVQLETRGATLLPGFTAQLKASLTATTLRLTEMQLRSTPLTVKASGVVSTTAQTALTYEVAMGDLTTLQPYTGAPVQAPGRFHGTLQGTWPALQIRSRLDLRGWRYGPWHGQRWQADLAVVQWPIAPQATLKTQWGDFQGPTWPKSTVVLTGTATPSQGTVQLNITAGPYRTTSLEGRFTLADVQRLTLTRLHLQHQQEVSWDNAGPLTLTRQADGQLALAGLVLRQKRQELRAQGILTADGGVQADVQLHHVSILPHLRAMAVEGMPIDGEVTAHLGLSGTLTRLQGEGTLAIAGLRWQQQAMGEIQSRMRLNDMTLAFDLAWQDRSQALVHLVGDIGLQSPHALAVQLQAPALELQRFQALQTLVSQSTGTAQADLRLSGTLHAPQIYGTVELRHGVLQLAATGVQYKDIQLQLTCQGTRVDLTHLHMTAGEGTLALTGWAEHAGFAVQALSLDLQMQRFMAIHTPKLEAEVSAALTIRGTLADILATGTITIPQARAQLGGTLAGGRDTVQPWQLTVEGVYGVGPRNAQTTTATPNAADAHDPLAFLRTDVQIDLPRNVWVRGPGTAIELSGGLTLTKEHDTPFSLSGTVETVRGFASFYSGRFVVEQGRVTFTGATDVNPVLDIILSREVSNYVVSVNVGGRANTPQLHLSSTPDLPQADIVTLLVVGKTTERLTAAERSGLSNQAQQIVGNVAAGELEQLLAKPLGLDTLDVQTGSKLGDGKVSVGRYITQDIFLSYERGLGDAGGDKVGVEYSMNRHLKLKGSSNSNTGDAALDMLWRIDY